MACLSFGARRISLVRSPAPPTWFRSVDGNPEVITGPASKESCAWLAGESVKSCAQMNFGHYPVL